MTKDRVGEQDSGATWTNETLPLKVRRDLMKRELRRVLADKNVASASAAAAERDESGPSTQRADKDRP